MDTYKCMPVGLLFSDHDLMYVCAHMYEQLHMRVGVSMCACTWMIVWGLPECDWAYIDVGVCMSLCKCEHSTSVPCTPVPRSAAPAPLLRAFSHMQARSCPDASWILCVHLVHKCWLHLRVLWGQGLSSLSIIGLQAQDETRGERRQKSYMFPEKTGPVPYTHRPYSALWKPCGQMEKLRPRQRVPPHAALLCPCMGSAGSWHHVPVRHSQVWISKAVSPSGRFINPVQWIEWLTCLLIALPVCPGTWAEVPPPHPHQPRRRGDTRSPQSQRSTCTWSQLLTIIHSWWLGQFNWIFLERDMPVSSKIQKANFKKAKLVNTTLFFCSTRTWIQCPQCHDTYAGIRKENCRCQHWNIAEIFAVKSLGFSN